MPDLIMLDLYGTLVNAFKKDNTPRKGIYSFLEKNKSKKVIVTDDPCKDYVKSILSEQGILDHFAEIYTGEDLIAIKNYRGKRKDLARICSLFAVAASQAVFIGDGERDRLDAKREGVKFIHLPKYLENNEPFSFELVSLPENPKNYLDLRRINYLF